MSAKLTTRYLAEQDFPAWTDLVANSPEGSIYSTPEYLDVLCSETDGRFRILVAERGGEMVGGIALFERSNMWGTCVGGRLLLYYNGFVLKHPASKYPSERTAQQLQTLAALEETIAKNGYGRIRIRNRDALQDVRVFLDRGWDAQPSFSYVVPLAALDDLWARIEQNLRRLINRAERDGIELSEDDDFKSFYRLHVQTHARKGSAIYLPEAGFRRYFERLSSQGLCRLFHARTSDGRAISSQLVLLGKHSVCHTVSAAADAEFLKTGATPFLRWKVFERLSQMGYTGNDLTDAELNPVTHFKGQLGGDLRMNLVLVRPDRGRFRVNAFVYRTGRLVRRRAGRLIAVIKGSAE